MIEVHSQVFFVILRSCSRFGGEAGVGVRVIALGAGGWELGAGG
jgi:hypothetical protein